jgi:hypothetical protein
MLFSHWVPAFVVNVYLRLDLASAFPERAATKVPTE